MRNKRGAYKNRTTEPCTICGNVSDRYWQRNPPICNNCNTRLLDNRSIKHNVCCDYNVASNCVKCSMISYRAEDKNRYRNAGRYICLQCSRFIKNSGRKNPNTKYYNLDDSFFDKIDSVEKAYFLGWIASDGSISKGGFTVSIRDYDYDTLSYLRNLICKEIPIVSKNNNMVCFTVNSKKIVADLCRHLKLETPGKKDFRVKFPDLETKELDINFIAGYFDGDGCIPNIPIPPIYRYPKASITSNSLSMLQSILDKIGIKGNLYPKYNVLEWNGNSALDVLGLLYSGCRSTGGVHRLYRKYALYDLWATWEPCISGLHNSYDNIEGSFRCCKLHENAVFPSKSRVSDSGYDLTLIEKVSTGFVEMYNTGISIQPAYGYYFDLVPRSSIIKSGYILANSVGVIDRTYVGPIYVPLIKVDPNAPELKLPCKIVQIIPRRIIHANIISVESFDETDRGSGGFGSTDNL